MPLYAFRHCRKAAIPRISILVSGLVFIRQKGFPRRWSALTQINRSHVGLITQEHERNEQGESVFRYRAEMLPQPDLGLFTTLRAAKQALTEALQT